MDPPRPHLRTWLSAAAIVIIIVVAVRAVRSLRPEDPRIALADTITALRVRADSCRSAVDRAAAQMRTYDRTLDSMRARVRDMEALDERGVPADSYVVYMTAFRAYNDSAGVWPSREDSVRAQDARCRDIAVRHNVLADSLRRLVIPVPAAPD